MYLSNRSRGIGLLFCSMLLSACTGGADQLDWKSLDPGTATPTAISLTGTTGSPSLTNATLTVRDADGQMLAETSSDTLAQFQVDIGEGAKLPLLLTASGGIDLVTGLAPETEYTAMATEPTDASILVSPLSSVMTAAHECAGLDGNPDALWATVAQALPMGLDTTVNPQTAALTPENAARLMLANELLSEALRRAQGALVNAGTPVNPDDIVRAIGCDLGDDGTLNGSGDGDVRAVAVFRATEAAVLIESLAAQLTIAGQPAGTVLDTALATVLGRSDVSIADVAPDAARIAEARRAISVFVATWPEPDLIASAADLDGDPVSVAARLATRFDQSRREALDALSANVASVDDTSLADLESRMRAQSDTAAPVMSFVTSSSSIQAGDTATLSWAATDADACQADLGWSGPQPVEGTFETDPLTATGNFALTCVGLGGVSARTLQITVDGSVTEPRPVVTLQAAPQTVTAGTAADLTWSASNATSCTASGAWSGTRATSGSASTGPLGEPATFTLECSGPGGTDLASVSVGIEAAVEPPPSVTLTAGQTTVGAGGSTTLTWTSANAGSCQASGGWSGTKASAGSESIGPINATNTYLISCTGPGGSANDEVQITVDTPDAPTLSFQSSATTIDTGASVQLSWTATNADTCTAGGGWSGSRATSGTATVGPLDAPTTFQLSCTGAGGSVDSSVTVNLRPEITLTTSAAEVTEGDSVELTWSSDYADSCAASGGWFGSRPVSGSASSGPISADTTFSLSCTGAGGTSTASVSVAALPAPDPTVSLSVADTVIGSGETTTLAWSSTNADQCEASGSWNGTKAMSGSESVSPLSQASTFTLTCSGAGGSATASATVNLRPEVTLNASPSQILAGESVEVSWTSSYATSCTASGSWSGTRAVSGTRTVGPLSADSTFRLDCSGPGGTMFATASVAVETPTAPSVNLASSATQINEGESATLTWSASDADGCTASGGWSGNRSTSGSESTGPLTQTTTYALSCSGSGGNASDSVTVNVTALPDPSVTLTADDTLVQSGATTRLVWSSTNATACRASGGWSGTRATSGAEVVGPLTASSTYTLSCSNSAGSAVAMVAVDVTGTLSVSWAAPTENVDGTPLTDLARYKIYYGPSSRNYTDSVVVTDASATSFSFSVPAGSYYVAMTAIDAQSNESALSNEVLKTTQ